MVAADSEVIIPRKLSKTKGKMFFGLQNRQLYFLAELSTW